MYAQKSSFYYAFMVSIVIIVLFSALNYLHLTPGTFIDWLVGLLAFWWLMGITTIPWNTYFSAREVLDEAAISESKGIQVNPKNIAYASKLSKWFFILAISLHILSAGILYLIAYLKITEVGYIASVVALLLTAVRPLGRSYEYLAEKLRTMRNEIQYPREDVFELRRDLTALEARLEINEQLLNISKEDSWASVINQRSEYLKKRVTELHVELDGYRIQNEKEHERLSRKSMEDIARLSEDAQFLNQVRELIRFVKNT